MNFNPHAIERPRDRGGLVMAGIIDEDDFIDDLVRDHFIIGLAQSPGRVVGRHHDDDLFPFNIKQKKPADGFEPTTC